MNQLSKRWQAELKRLPARSLSDLPEAMKFVLYLSKIDRFIEITSWEIAEPREASTTATLDALEYHAMVAGAESDRFFVEDLLGLCERKAADDSERLDTATALQGANPETPSSPLSFGDLLHRLGATLVAVVARDVAQAAASSDVETRHKTPAAA